jgi:hypothetical protein
MPIAAGLHLIRLTLKEPVASEVIVGSDVVLRVNAACRCGCDLTGRLVLLMDGEETLGSSVEETVAVRSPARAGEHAWTLIFPEQDVGGRLHERVSLSISFQTVPVPTSLAVWDVPTPVVAGTALNIKVGVKSSMACSLGGAAIECLDASGTIIGGGQLASGPWPGTVGLYWTDVQLMAPATEGLIRWTARFVGSSTELQHASSSAQFSFAVVPRSECRLTIRFLQKDTAKPIENAYVRLGPFRACTDAAGVARLLMPRGRYEVCVWHAAYEADPVGVDVYDDVEINLVGVAVPEEDPSARFMM